MDMKMAGTQNAEEGQAPEGSATSEESAPDTSYDEADRLAAAERLNNQS
jgi:hypothetical protein